MLNVKVQLRHHACGSHLTTSVIVKNKKVVLAPTSAHSPTLMSLPKAVSNMYAGLVMGPEELQRARQELHSRVSHARYPQEVSNSVLKPGEEASRPKVHLKNCFRFVVTYHPCLYDSFKLSLKPFKRNMGATHCLGDAW